MVFSIWWRTWSGSGGSTVQVTALGKTETASITTSWTRYHMAISNPSGTDITILPPNGAPNIYLCMAQLEVGETPSDWRESQEQYASQAEFTITQGKVETAVTALDSVVRETAIPGNYQVFVSGGNSMVSETTVGGNTETTMEITPESFTVNTGRVELSVPNESLRVDGDGASMRNLTVTDSLIAPNVAQLYTGKNRIWVKAGETSTSQHDAYDTLTAALSALSNKMISGGKDIQIYVLEDQYGDAKLTGVFGNAFITIIGAARSGSQIIATDRDVNGRLYFGDCTSTIRLSGINVFYNANNTKSACTFEQCMMVIATDCDFVLDKDSSEDRAAFEISWATSAILTNCYVYSYYGSAIRAGQCTRLHCKDISGMGGLALETTGAVVTWTGTIPRGDFDCLENSIWNPADMRTLSVDPPYPDPEPTPPVITPIETVQIPAYQTGNAYSKNSWAGCTWQSSSQGNYIRQGADNNAQYMGCAWFVKPSSITGNVTVKSAMLTLRRNTDTGGSNPVSVTIYSNMVTKDTGNPNTNKQNETYLGYIAKGEALDFSTDGLKNIAQAIMDGTANCVVIYANDNPTGTSGRYSSNWARFDGIDETIIPVLTVTYQQSS